MINSFDVTGHLRDRLYANGFRLHRTGRSEALDAIRGIAVLQVLLWHLWAAELTAHSKLFGGVLRLTWTGVDLFFVLSGFLIGGVLMDNRRAPRYFSVFYGRRFLRILPLYIISLPLMFIASQLDFKVPYAFFVQNFVWARQGHWGPFWSGITWSLAVEEQFYCVLPAIVRFTPFKKLPFVLAGLAIAAPALRIFIVPRIYGNPYAAYLLFPCRMDALFGGAMIAWAIRHPLVLPALRRWRSTLYATVLTFLVGVVAMAVAHFSDLSQAMRTFGYSLIALFYASVLLAVVIEPSLRLPIFLRPLRWAGLGAYSMYLFHRGIQIAVSHHAHGVAINATTTLLTFALAPVSWFLVERPLVMFGHRRFKYGDSPEMPEPHEIGVAATR